MKQFPGGGGRWVRFDRLDPSKIDRNEKQRAALPKGRGIMEMITITSKTRGGISFFHGL